MKANRRFRQTQTDASTHAARTRAGVVSLLDNRPGAVAARDLADAVRNSSRVVQQKAVAAAIGRSRRMIAQREQLQPRTIAADDTAAIQMRVHVRSGKRYEGAKPETVGKIRDIANAAGTFLVQSDEDIQAMKGGQDAPILAPKKHLIGEHHERSEFTRAVEAWGWGTTMLIEPYSTHERLKNPSEQALRSGARVTEGTYDESFMFAKAQALENTAAKGLTNLVNAQIFGAKAVRIAETSSEAFRLLDQRDLTTACEQIQQKYGVAAAVATSLASYFRESTEERGLGILGSYFPEHALIQQTVTVTLLREIGEAQENVSNQVRDPTRLVLDKAILAKCNAHIDALVAILQKLVAAFDRGVRLDQVERMSGEALANRDVGKLDPLRERYMVANINAAAVPALVKIGRQHVDHLKTRLPAETVAYDDYAAFRDKNTFRNVDV